MSIFSSRAVESVERATPQMVRSRFQQILDDLNEAHVRMDHAAGLFTSLIADIEKGMRFIDRFRVDLTKAIEDTGGEVTPDPTTIEEQVRAYVAPQMQKVQE